MSSPFVYNTKERSTSVPYNTAKTQQTRMNTFNTAFSERAWNESKQQCTTPRSYPSWPPKPKTLMYPDHGNTDHRYVYETGRKNSKYSSSQGYANFEQVYDNRDIHDILGAGYPSYLKQQKQHKMSVVQHQKL
jgi:hypothetical protein